MDRITKVKLKFVDWFFHKFPDKYCWADCVSWAFSNKINPFRIESSSGCKIESKEHEHEACYCGVWLKGECYHTLPQEKKDIIQTERNPPAFHIPNDPLNF